MDYASFGKRLLAYIIDWMIIGVAGSFFIFFAGYYLYLAAGWFLGALYFVLMEGGQWHATLGKKAMGIIVVDANGAGITYGTAVVRYLGKLVSSITLGIGYLIAAFTENCQALHDKIASTYVINVQPAVSRYQPVQPGPRPAASAPAQMTGRCVVGINGEFAGQAVSLAPSGTMIGRDTVACQIALSASAPGVSRHHCQINFNPQTGMFILNDLGSSYGTFLQNGTRIASGQPTALRPGERFYIGSQSNMFEVR